ncbi:hypothetical protein FDP41_006606 [Naegleria fowleri]|uniref:Glutathione transferase n=1 Tax=Naegleria fowleri TaxID=5763 RepID=A0A6A5BKI9_NAEFO|nr:uncharacterized protein FDP41_006606 [Naegleria fowleri]KAF0974574.1 hypothetical protein FDP41_006606 [Naegleria fowleri]
MSPSKPVLTYFNSRGKSEIIRLILAEAGVDYEEVNVGVWHPTDKSEQFQQLVQSGTLAFDSLPSYKDDQIFLVQSAAIVRYLAKRYGLSGSNLVEESLIDQFYEGVLDITTLLRSAFNVMYPVTKEVSSATIEETMEMIGREKLPNCISHFERALKGKTFLVGEKISYADIALFYILDNLLELNAEYTNKFILDKNENLKAFYNRIKSREGIQKHVNHPNRFPKQNLPGYENVLSKLVQQ